MPGMTGTEFFLKFSQFCTTLVIFLSANAYDSEDRLCEMGFSAQDYVAKPHSTQLFIKRANILLRG